MLSELLDVSETKEIWKAFVNSYGRFTQRQIFRRTNFGSRLLAAEGEGGGGSESEGREDRCG